MLSGAADPYIPPTTFLYSEDGFLGQPVAGEPLEIALTYLQAHASEQLGLSPADLAQPLVTDLYTDADSGLSHVYLRQRVHGLEIAFADLNIALSATGQVLTVGGGFVPGLSSRLDPLGNTPEIGPVEAVRLAAGRLGIDLQSEPLIVQQESGPVPLYLIAAPDLSLDRIPARLHYVPTADGSAILAWQLIVRTPSGDNWFDLSVPAHGDSLDIYGDVVVQSDWVSHASYNALPLPAEHPQDGGFVIQTDPQSLIASPFGWHDTNGVSGGEFSDTRGNNVDAHLDRDGNNVADASPPRPNGGATLDFSGIAFDPALAPSALRNQQAAVVNLFVMNNILHDIHYQYGFTEAAGNFQLNNYGRGGVAGDALLADAQDNAANGSANNANFATPPDGFAPRMQMYEFSRTTPRRDSSLDNNIIIHEYGHGVSNRLTGGPSNSSALTALQSDGMGEGWSDWYSLMFLQRPTDLQNDGLGLGTYVLGQLSTGVGIRRQPYSFDLSIDPVTWSAFGTGPGQSTQEHHTGEIWASTLWDMNWLLINKHGYDSDLYTGYTGSGPGGAGNKVALRLVMDAMKLQPANPSFVQGRDAILAADVVLTGGDNACEIWTAFARRGLGESASTPGAGSPLVSTSFEVLADVCGLSVTASIPAAESTVTTAPTNYLVDFSEAIDVSTVEAGDFTVNGVPADSFVVVTPLEVVFHYNAPPFAAEGEHAMSLAGGSILGADDGSPLLAFSETFRYDTAPLAVVATDPPLVGGVIALSAPLALEVTFNEAIDPSSVEASDLSLSGIAGATVSEVEVLPGDTAARFLISGVNAEGTLRVSMAAGAIWDVHGNPNPQSFNASFEVDGDVLPFPGVAPRPPLGSLVYESSVSGAIFSAEDEDVFTLAVNAGWTLTVLVSAADGGLHPAVEVRDPAGAVVASATAAASGGDALLLTLPAVSSGSYSIAVSGASGSRGTYTARAIINAALETEAGVENSNDTLAAVQDLNGAAISIAGGASRLAAIGSVGGETIVAAEDFDEGTLPPSFTTYSSDSFGRTRLIPPIGSGNPSAYALWMDSGSAGDAALNEAVYTVDLAGLTRAVLTFSHIQFSDEADSLPPDFSGHFNGDGVAISDDGNRWRTVLSAPADASWADFSVDLAAAAAAAGMTLGPNFQIKFQQFDNFSYPTDGRAYDDIQIVVPDVVDNYQFTLAEGDIATVALKSNSGGGIRLQLRDAEGMVVGSGATGPANLDFVLSDFQAPSGSTYYLEIAGADSQLAYSAVIVRNASFDLEANDASETAQSIGTAGSVLGAIAPAGDSSVADEDWYAIELASVQNPLRLQINPLIDASDALVHALTPRLELYSPSNELVATGAAMPDGRNKLIQYEPLSAGVYRLRVSGEDGTNGEYFLSTGPGPSITAVTVTSPISEGDVATINGTFRDVSEQGEHTVVIDWGSGEQPTTLTLAPGVLSFSASHFYLEDSQTSTASGPYPISVTVTNSLNESAMASASVTVHNVAPVIASLGEISINEGDTYSLTGTLFDRGLLDTHLLTIDWGAGEGTTTLTTGGDNPPGAALVHLGNGEWRFTASHTYADDRPSGTLSDVLELSISVTDDDGGNGSETTMLTVQNVAPSLVLDDIADIEEGGLAVLRGVIGDPGAIDTFLVTIDWGDPLSSNAESIDLSQPPSHVRWNAATKIFEASHRYLDSPPAGWPSEHYTIEVRLEDDDSATVDLRTQVTVNNAPPKPVLESITDPRLEGRAINVIASASDAPADQQSLAYGWRVLKVGSSELLATGSDGASFSFTPENEGIYRVELTVSDDDGGSTTIDQTIVVSNLAPLPIDLEITTTEDTPAELLLAATDVQGDPLSYAIIDPPQHGTLMGVAPNLSYVPSSDYHGADSFTYRAHDGVAAGATATVLLQIAAVNDAPAFTAGPDLHVTDESGGTSIDGWTAPVAGPADELDQTLSFVVSTDNGDLFASLPEIDASGKLTFTVRPNVSGAAVVAVQLQDDGGTESGGVASSTQVFAIFVTKPRPWHNTAVALDVSGDLAVSPLDALIVFNFLNANGAQAVPLDAVNGPTYFDINDDAFVSSLDALLVINYLNGGFSEEVVSPSLSGESVVDSYFHALGSAEGEAASADDELAVMLAALSSDPNSGRRRGSQ